MFSCEICEISKNTFFTEHLRAAASETSKRYILDVWQGSEYKAERLWLTFAKKPPGLYKTLFCFPSLEYKKTHSNKIV